MHHDPADPADPAGLAEQWPLPGSEALRDELLAAYADPSRGYHDTRHLAEVLDRLGLLGGASLPVVLAAWFHDAVYDGERDAEERSAAWAEEALPGLVPEETAAEVARLVRLTETHSPAPDDLAGGLLCDADLAILASDRTRYDDYVAAVRREFAHLGDDDFAAGRAAVLAHLAAQEHLFHTEAGRGRWEAAARANLEAELAGLTARS